MISDFNITISKDDFIRIINRGFSELIWPSRERLVKPSDYVSDVQYSRNTKQYTLICKSGTTVKITDRQEQVTK